MMKICPKCKRSDPPCGFHSNRAAKDGLHSYCKDCRKEYNNPKRKPFIPLTDEQKRANAVLSTRRWRRKNRDRVRAYQKRYREAHKDEISAYAKRWNAKHPDYHKLRRQKKESKNDQT